MLLLNIIYAHHSLCILLFNRAAEWQIMCGERDKCGHMPTTLNNTQFNLRNENIVIVKYENNER